MCGIIVYILLFESLKLILRIRGELYPISIISVHLWFNVQRTLRHCTIVLAKVFTCYTNLSESLLAENPISRPKL